MVRVGMQGGISKHYKEFYHLFPKKNNELKIENKLAREVYLRSENIKNAKCFYTVCSKKQLSDDIYIVFVILLKKLII